MRKAKKANKCPFCSSGDLVDTWYTHDFYKESYSCGSVEITWDCKSTPSVRLCAEGNNNSKGRKV